MFIPLDAIAHPAQDRAYINIPKLVVGKLPWNERPTGESTRAKMGPPTDEVHALYRSYAPTGTSNGPPHAATGLTERR